MGLCSTLSSIKLCSFRDPLIADLAKIAYPKRMQRAETQICNVIKTVQAKTN